jgi:CubicO group peptidase (beta-lactamase class C family)
VTRRWGRDPFRTSLVQTLEGAARQATTTSTAPGLAVALVHTGSWSGDRMTGQPVTAATRFQAASLSKPVTAWGVLRLVEAGRIGLDEPVPGHLRRWRPPRRRSMPMASLSVGCSATPPVCRCMAMSHDANFTSAVDLRGCVGTGGL